MLLRGLHTQTGFLRQARPLLAPVAHWLAPVRCASIPAPEAPAPSSATAPPEEPAAAESGSAAFLASVPPERLKQLQRDGLALKDVIKLGRKGAAPGLAIQVRQRWYTSEVARLYCHGKFAANMKLLVQQVEKVTGGIVVHRAGGTMLVYRGDDWKPPRRPQRKQQPPQQAPPREQPPQPQQQQDSQAER